MANKEYFSHDYNTRSDDKVKLLIRKYGMTGYGVFWSLIEDLYNNANALRLDCDGIAYDLHTDSDIIRWIIFESKLFRITNDEAFFSSDTVKERLKLRKTKSVKASESAALRWTKRNAIALPTHSSMVSDSNAIKEKKRKEKENVLPPTPTGGSDTGSFEVSLNSENVLKNPESSKTSFDPLNHETDRGWILKRPSTRDILLQQDLALVANRVQQPIEVVMDELEWFARTHARTAMSDGMIIKEFGQYLTNKHLKAHRASTDQLARQQADEQRMRAKNLPLPTPITV